MKEEIPKSLNLWPGVCRMPPNAKVDMYLILWSGVYRDVMGMSSNAKVKEQLHYLWTDGRGWVTFSPPNAKIKRRFH